MNKLVLAVALATLGSVAQAQDVWSLKEGQIIHDNDKYFDVSVGYTYSRMTDDHMNGDPRGDTHSFFPTSRTSKGDGYNIGLSYTTFQTQNIFLQPTIQYITTGSQDSDKYLLGKLNVGYRIDLDNGPVQYISPKVGFGAYHNRSKPGARAYHNRFDGGSRNGVTYGAGVEFGLNEKASIEVAYNYIKIDKKASNANLTTVALKYKF